MAKEIIKLDKFHYHEVTDRSYVYMDGFHEYVAEHVAVLANPELKKRADDLVDLMYKFYSLTSMYADEGLAMREDINVAKTYEYEEEIKE